MAHLYRLAYFSRCMLPESDLRAFSGGVRDILEHSREWNLSHQLTGALLFNARYFAQVLEGPADAVQATYGHICCDRRNRDPKLLEYGPSRAREFAGWAMAYVDGPNHASVPLARLDRPLETSTGLALLEMLRWLVMAESEA
jgi:hypothetical protein